MQKGTCKHFNGTWHNKECMAGVCYADVIPRPDDNLGRAFRVPCRIIEGTEYDQLNAGQKSGYDERGTCDKFEEPTDEEIREHDEEIEAAVQRHMRTLPLIAKVKEEQEGRDWQGVVSCPVCSGKLHLSHSAYNGHVWGRCDTEDCLSWME